MVAETELARESSEISAVARIFRERAKKLQRSASINLMMVIGLLIVGIGVFVFAGTLANRESEQVIAKEQRARLEFVQSEKSKIAREMTELEHRITAAEKRLTEESQGTGGTGRIGQGPVYKLLQDNLAGLQSDREALRFRMRDIEQQEASITDEIAKGMRSPQTLLDQNQLSVLISAIATRVGAIVLLLFLVKILVPLYRYNVKLASYYDARADALQIGLFEGTFTLEAFEKLASVLTPTRIDFAASPISPADQAFELAKHVVTSQKLG